VGVGPVCSAVGGVAGSAAGSVANSVLGTMTSWVVDGASWLLGQVGGAMTSSTTINLTAGWFTQNYHVMVGIAGVVVLPLLLLSVIQAVYQQSAGVLIQVVLV
jgi:hypothetical protein